MLSSWAFLLLGDKAHSGSDKKENAFKRNQYLPLKLKPSQKWDIRCRFCNFAGQKLELLSLRLGTKL